MKVALIGRIVTLVLSKIIEPEALRKFGSGLIKFVEDFVLGTKSEVDDACVLPLCKMIRDTYGMDDYVDVRELLAAVAVAVMELLDPARLRLFVDMLLDHIENYIIGTGSTIDDALVLPLCQMIRTTFDIPDNDELPLGDPEQPDYYSEE